MAQERAEARLQEESLKNKDEKNTANTRTQSRPLMWIINEVVFIEYGISIPSTIMDSSAGGGGGDRPSARRPLPAVRPPSARPPSSRRFFAWAP